MIFVGKPVPAFPDHAPAARRFALFQRGVDRGELGVELGSKPVHDGNDGQRNSSRDQPVLDRGGAGLVRKKSANGVHGACTKFVFHAAFMTYKSKRRLNPIAEICPYSR